MKIVYAIFTFICLNANFALSGELKPEQIVAKSWQLYRQTPDEQETIEVVVSYFDGRRDTKALTRWIKYGPDGEEDKIAVKFHKPAMDEGLGLLTWRHAQKSADQWLKLPSLERVRRVSPGEQDKYFAGTDLTYEDLRQLTGERIRDFTYRLIQREGEQSVIEILPNNGIKTGYSRRIAWIGNAFVLHKMEYYGKNGKLLKIQTNNDITLSDNGLWRTDCIEVNNLMLNRRTSLRVIDRQLNSNLPAEIFSVRFLETKAMTKIHSATKPQSSSP